MYKPTIAVDFDGVLHTYSRGWDDGSIYDVPIPGALDGLQRLYDDGWNIVIFTCRVSDLNHQFVQERADAIRAWIDSYRDGHTFEIADVVGYKPLAASLFIDDRAIKFVNWEQTLSEVVPPQQCSSCLGNGFADYDCPECEKPGRATATSPTADWPL